MKLKTAAKITIIISSVSLLLLSIGLLRSSDSNAKSAKYDQSAATELININKWRPLAELVDTQRLNQIIADNTTLTANRTAISGSAVGLVTGDFLVVDFQSPALCDRNSCAIAGYKISTGEQLLFTHAFRAEGQPIVEFIEHSGAGFPYLLALHSFKAGARGLTRDTLRYLDGEWIREAR